MLLSNVRTYNQCLILKNSAIKQFWKALNYLHLSKIVVDIVMRSLHIFPLINRKNLIVVANRWKDLPPS